MGGGGRWEAGFLVRLLGWGMGRTEGLKWIEIGWEIVYSLGNWLVG